MKANLRYWVMMLALAGAALAMHALSHGEPMVLSTPLKNFPLELGAWHGAEMPLDADTLKVAAVDDYLNRMYRASDGKALGLYVGYYKSQQTGDAIHSPKNCLPGSGWQPVTAGRLNIALPNGSLAPVNLYVIEKGLDRQVVLYWYQSHGRIIASEYSAKYYMVRDAIRMNRTDSALVRIVVPFKRDREAAQDYATSFAQQMLKPLETFIPN
ncbi:MAG: exosortase C-terminal domain/associated protein EpsI [Candidatus Sulfotelmatobacter sp.]